MSIFLGTFIVLVFLREQIVNGAPANTLYLPPTVQNQPLVEVVNEDDPNNEGFDENEHPEDNNLPRQEALPAQQAANENIGRDMDRLVDDMTWYRLLGLDGSFVFIEHVFWVISLNIVFTVVFCKFLTFTI